MNTVHRKQTAESILRIVPTKWAIAIVVALIAYVLLQPKLNQWFGWKLPSISQSEETSKPSKKPSTVTKDNTPKKLEGKSASDAPGEPAPSQQESKAKGPKSSDTPSPTEPISTSSKPASKTNTSTSERTESASAKSAQNFPSSVEEFLKAVGRDRFESPEGLIYAPGSDEGHRLKHIERHLKDQPDRPGSHGVFNGQMVEFLIAIDDAYARANRNDKGTKKYDDNGAMIYEASFEKPIGFLGGQTGKRQKNPKLKKLRVVVRGNSVVTAFPF